MILAIYFIWGFLFGLLLGYFKTPTILAVPMIIINAVVTNPYLLGLI